MDISDHYARNDSSLLLHNERTCGFDDVRPGFGRSGGHRGSATDRPPDILNRKYDQGEINTQEHKEKKKDITGGT